MIATRIVTLVPSATEIVAALGGEAAIVGISHECDFPPAIRDRPALTAPRIALGSSSHAIDAAVRWAAAQSTAIYSLDVERLRALQPDLIVTQGQCALCAVSDEDLVAHLARWEEESPGRAPAVVSLTGESVEGIGNDIARVAAAMGVPERGRALVARMRERMNTVAARAIRRGFAARVLFLDWLDPLITAGAYLPELVALAGGVPVLAEPGGPYVNVSLDMIRAAAPDLIIAAPCGFGLERAAAELAPVLEELHARGARPRAVAADGNQFFNRPGPRLVESLEMLAEALYPEDFPFGWDGVAFARRG